MTVVRKFRVLAVALAIALAFAAGQAFGAQGHMDAALDHLNLARTQLQAADRDKGGHRDRALDLTQRAIAEVKLGVTFARTH